MEISVKNNILFHLSTPHFAIRDVVKYNFTTSQFYCGNSDISTLLFKNTDK